MTEIAFDVLDVGAGLVRLEKRSPTLSGSVPLRVARGCDPMLEGNAYGFQLTLALTVAIRRGLGGLALELAGPRAASCAAALRAAPARLVARGVLAPDNPWAQRLARGFWWSERAPARAAGPLLRLWTGLCVRPRAGVWLRLSNAANRRNRLLAVREVCFADTPEWVPLVVDVSFAARALRLEGEIACLGPIAPRVRVSEQPLARCPEVGRAHARFYDPAYFATKDAQITGKYRRLLATLGPAGGRARGKGHAASAQRERERIERELETAAHAAGAPSSGRSGRAEIVAVGPRAWDIERVIHVLGRDALEPVPWNAGERRHAPEVVRFDNTLAFRFSFDGHTLGIEPDREALARGAAEVERTWEQVYGPGSIEADRRALWYLTKYFTPHPPGEPHFFVKPWAFVRTLPGWSSLVEGVQHADYDVLRGVVATDAFFATPAVFAVTKLGEAVSVAERAPLVRVFSMPRSLLRAGYRSEALGDGLGAAEVGRT